jgi:multiple sugar transport system substrate-binding protein
MRFQSAHRYISRRFTIGIVLCLSLGLLGAQAGCAVRVTPTPEPVTITFACEEDDEPYYKPLIEEFNEQYGHITVELVRYQQFDWPEADVWDVSPFTRHFMDLYDYEALDLMPFIERGDPYGKRDPAFKFDREDFNPGVLELFQDGSEVWAVPYTIFMQAMYYNRDLFDQHGVTHPQIEWTWDDFKRAGQAMYRPQSGTYGYTPDVYRNDPLSFIYQNGGRVFDDLKNPTRTTFDDPLTVEALDWYARLMLEDEAAATPQQAREAYGIADPLRTGIREGRLGMWTGDLSHTGGGIEDKDLAVNWGVAPLPKGVQSATFSFATGYVISAEAQNPDACWEWIVFLTHQVPPYGMPVRKSLLESEAFEDEVGEDVAAVARHSIEHALLLSPEAWEIYGQFQTFDEALARIFSGRATALEAMQWAQETSGFK